MDKLLLIFATACGLGGLLLCAAAVVSRFSGSYWLGGMQVGTLMLAGTAAMVAGCLALLTVLVRRSLAGR
jgi:hypothetical protein